jgi:hypothetical protein
MLPQGAVAALYFGSEFCEDRLPNLGEAIAFCALARELGLEPTLQTPLVTSRGLRVVGALVEALAAAGWKPAVVFNDWGVLRLLRESHPALARRAGRLVNRSLRDPRAYGNHGYAPSGAAKHDASRFARLRRMLAAYGVTAVESDADLDGGYLGDGPDDGAEGLSRTLHLPFTFAASGRGCPLKSALYPGSDGFTHALADPFSAPCRGRPLPIRRADTPLPHWRAGNTVFYEIPPEAARARLTHVDRIVLHEMAAP